MYIELVLNGFDGISDFVMGEGIVIKASIKDAIMGMRWYRATERGNPVLLNKKQADDLGITDFLTGATTNSAGHQVNDSEKRWDEGRFQFYTTRVY